MIIDRDIITKFILVAAFLFVLPGTALSASFDHDHGAWNLLLKEHVRWNYNRTTTEVDYAGFKKRQDFLERYLQTLSAVTRQEFDRFSNKEQLAFLINAYNAFTVDLILSEYPDVESIKDLGSFFTSPWKKSFFRLFGKKETLDGIEHDLIRGSGRYNEPLIHFAVNCASIGCPALRNEAYTAAELDKQLLDSTRRFLKDRTRNRFNPGFGRIDVSRIFDWYAEDFAQGWRGYDSLHDFFRAHVDWITDDQAAKERLMKDPLTIRFLDYDWRLNSSH